MKATTTTGPFMVMSVAALTHIKVLGDRSDQIASQAILAVELRLDIVLANHPVTSNNVSFIDKRLQRIVRKSPVCVVAKYHVGRNVFLLVRSHRFGWPRHNDTGAFDVVETSVTRVGFDTELPILRANGVVIGIRCVFLVQIAVIRIPQIEMRMRTVVVVGFRLESTYKAIQCKRAQMK